MISLEDSIDTIKGVGPKKAQLLNKLGIYCVNDLLMYVPRAYEDRSVFKTIAELGDGDKVSVKAKVISIMADIRVRRNLVITKIKIGDETGTAYAVWYNCPFLKSSLIQGREYCFYGKVSLEGRNKSIASPTFADSNNAEDLTIGSIVPLYSLTATLTDNYMRKMINDTLSQLEGKIEDYIPLDIKKDQNLCDINFAIKNIHFPQDEKSYEIARNRLAFDELFITQVSLLFSREKDETENGIKFEIPKEYESFFEKLPYSLTGAQQRSMNDIVSDVTSGRSMNRLVQGDVGSGKTVIALLSLLICVKNGFQGALMAPTEVLANQHYDFFSEILKEERIALITGSVKRSKKKDIIEALTNGEIDIIIGTHALLEENVVFSKIGMIITDEQHRFGVRQRYTLMTKGNRPHTIVMSATPIPRTLSMILYGDLNISIIDELPPGRKEVETFHINSSYLERMYNFLRQQIKSGRQVYYVCPLVEESEAIEAEAVLQTYEKIKDIFKEFEVGFLYGKMKPDQKNLIIQEFKEGKIKILVSTTVIEVGVNVPNASVMVIHNSERFGLSQLHQLRGRVGRGSYQSYCILISDSKDKVTINRLKIMCGTNDGFVIAEKDLELRGPGDFFGTRQHGIPNFRVANLFKDKDILLLAQKAAKKILMLDPKLESEEYSIIKKRVNIFLDKGYIKTG